jgi:hypothetical protein
VKNQRGIRLKRCFQPRRSSTSAPITTRKKLCQPSLGRAKVVAGGGEDRVDAVAEASLEIIAIPSARETAAGRRLPTVN